MIRYRGHVVYVTTAAHVYTGGLAHSSAIVRCGHRLGEHSAARVAGEQPCFADHDGAECACVSFKKSPTQRGVPA